MNSVRLIAVGILVLAAAQVQSEGRIGLGAEPEFNSDGSIQVPVLLIPPAGESVAALQFDLAFEATQLQLAGAEAGSTALDASKSVHVNPLKPGTTRVIVAGLNRNALAEGTVAWARFTPAPGARPPFIVGLSGAILSDPFGTAVSVYTSPDTLTLDPGTALALATDIGRGTPSRVELLLRYRALIFASVLVGGALYMSRRRPKKGRVR